MTPSGARRRAMSSPAKPTNAAMMIQISSCVNVIDRVVHPLLEISLLIPAFVSKPFYFTLPFWQVVAASEL